MQKAIALLSGGFDSPVAIHLMRPHLDIIPVNFHQLPLTDGSEIEKVKALSKHLRMKKLYLVPFTPVLKALVEKCNHKHYFILSKIAMFRAAELLVQLKRQIISSLEKILPKYPARPCQILPALPSTFPWKSSGLCLLLTSRKS